MALLYVRARCMIAHESRPTIAFWRQTLSASTASRPNVSTMDYESSTGNLRSAVSDAGGGGTSTLPRESLMIQTVSQSPRPTRLVA
jgi:hypothetical protein